MRHTREPYYHVCSRCDAKFFSAECEEICPRCNAFSRSRERFRPPWRAEPALSARDTCSKVTEAATGEDLRTPKQP